MRKNFGPISNGPISHQYPVLRAAVGQAFHDCTSLILPNHHLH